MRHSLQNNGIDLNNNIRKKIQEINHQLMGIIDEQLENRSFASVFAKIAFFTHKYNVQGKTTYWLHRFRRFNDEIDKIDESRLSSVLKLGQSLLAQAESTFAYGTMTLSDDASWQALAESKQDELEYMPESRVWISAYDSIENILMVSEDFPGRPITLALNILEEGHKGILLQYLEQNDEWPLALHLLEITVDENTWQPKNIVIDPDYLIDVTAIANLFQQNHILYQSYILNKLLPTENNKYLIIGNAVNHFLDELILDLNSDFKKLFHDIFKIFPLSLTNMSDELILEIQKKCKDHYNRLKFFINNDFAKASIELSNCILEPSFISNKYGIQGRLDVLHKSKKSSIIELKSGKPYMPNSYGIKSDHYVQTLLYDLLIRSTGIDYKPLSYILYSSQDKDGLRFAPSVKSLQNKALIARNQIILFESSMRQTREEGIENILRAISIERMQGASSFQKRDAKLFWDIYNATDDVEKKYYLFFLAFIAREVALSKTGGSGVNGRCGLAGMWLKSIEEKKEEFNILAYYHLDQIVEQENRIILRFSKSEQSEELSNFRRGDVVAIYPVKNRHQPALKHQLFKGSIIKLSENAVEIRLRSRQVSISKKDFRLLWNIEHDVLDSSFRSMYSGLFYFLSSPIKMRNLFLGRRSPEKSLNSLVTEFTFSSNLLSHQKSAIETLIRSNELALLWGPPGTGKTSIVIRELIRYYVLIGKQIVLLAYTNRAVDELCSTVESLSESIDYVRIGSRYSTDEKFRENLLDHRLKSIQKRSGIKRLLTEVPIILSTISSFSGKREIEKLLRDPVLILDEASQVLEPTLIGLLPIFGKRILVGDHKQLPAVSIQNDELAKVNIKELNSIGFDSGKVSLFERLYHQFNSMEWQWAKCELKHQGRMHFEIMQFVNKWFYQGLLKVVPGIERLVSTSTTDLLIKGSRLVFINSQPDDKGGFVKTNHDEAKKIVLLIKNYLLHSEHSIENIPKNKIGVIVPFRAQIGLIRKKLFEYSPQAISNITIDTVERYQGGARDFIILSTCINHSKYLPSISSYTTEGMDRKLNVALTRAKEQIVLLGNKAVLSANEIYKDYIDSALEVRLI